MLLLLYLWSKHASISKYEFMADRHAITTSMHLSTLLICKLHKTLCCLVQQQALSIQTVNQNVGMQKVEHLYKNLDEKMCMPAFASCLALL
jgi:hypothetical protein